MDIIDSLLVVLGGLYAMAVFLAVKCKFKPLGPSGTGNRLIISAALLWILILIFGFHSGQRGVPIVISVAATFVVINRFIPKSWRLIVGLTAVFCLTGTFGLLVHLTRSGQWDL